MAKKTSKELFEEWRGKKVIISGSPAIVVGYDLEFSNKSVVIVSTDSDELSWGADALDPIGEYIDSTIETPYKRFEAAEEYELKLAE